MFSLLLKAEIYVKVSFLVVRRVPGQVFRQENGGERSKVDGETYPSMVTEDGVRLSWRHRPKKGQKLLLGTKQTSILTVMLFYSR